MGALYDMACQGDLGSRVGLVVCLAGGAWAVVALARARAWLVLVALLLAGCWAAHTRHPRRATLDRVEGDWAVVEVAAGGRIEMVDLPAAAGLVEGQPVEVP